MSDEIIKFPKLVDSSINSGVITYNINDMNKEKFININMDLLDEHNRINKLNFGCEYFTMVNLNYKLKSALNTIEESIKNMANK